jgi:hypothetical protein
MNTPPKVNLTITDKYIKIEFLKRDNTTAEGVRYFFTDELSTLNDELDGWWFNRTEEKEYNYKLLFSQILNLNGSAIGATTQAQVTTLILAAKASQQL